MSVCVKIVIKIEIEKKNQKIVIYIFCPYRTALPQTMLTKHIIALNACLLERLYVNNMSKLCTYIELYCALLYTQSTSQSCVWGGLSSTTTSVQHPLG